MQNKLIEKKIQDPPSEKSEDQKAAECFNYIFGTSKSAYHMKDKDAMSKMLKNLLVHLEENDIVDQQEKNHVSFLFPDFNFFIYFLSLSRRAFPQIFECLNWIFELKNVFAFNFSFFKSLFFLFSEIRTL